MKLFVFRPSMNVQRQGRVFEPGGSGGEPPFDSLSNHHSGHQQQQQHHPIYNNSRHAAGEDDPLQVYLKNGIVQSSKTAVFNLQKRQFKIIKNGSFQLSKMALKNITVRKKTSSRRCKNTSFSLLTNADEKLNISDELVDLNSLDVHVIGDKQMELEPDLLLDEIEVLA